MADKPLYPLFGIVSVLNTPYRSSGEIDYPALRGHVREALRAGVAGFLVPALAAEVSRLSEGERLAMVEAVLEETDGSVPVIAGTGGAEVATARKLTEKYLRSGCRNILFQIPFQGEEQFRRDFFELASTGPEMIMLQDWDARGYGLPDDLIQELFESVEAFRCLKVETVPAGVKYSRILERTGGRLNVSGGWAVTQMMEGLTRGVHAFLPTGMYWIYTEIYRRWCAGQREKAAELFHAILPVLCFSNQHLDISLHFFKHLFHRQGIYPTAMVREPVLPFDDTHRRIAEGHIETVLRLEQAVQAAR